MNKLNDYFTTIYYYLHPEHQQEVSHQSVRIMQFLQKEQHKTIQDIAKTFTISHNTASQHVKKLVLNGWVKKTRSEKDQRVVTVELTQDGLKVVKVNTELDSNKLSKVYATLTTEQQQQVEDAFQLLSEVAVNVHNH